MAAKLLLGLGVLLAAGTALGSGSGGGAATARTIGTRGKVTGISADGGRVAIRVSFEGPKQTCQYASTWRPATGSVVRFSGDSCFASGDNSDRHLGLTLGGTRVVWVDYDYGNHAYCDGPFTATTAEPAGRATVSSDCDPPGGAADYFFHFAGDASLLAVSEYLLCEANCVGENGEVLPDGEYGVTLDRLVGTRLVRILPPRDFRALLDANAGRVLVSEPKGELAVYSTAGKKLWSASSVAGTAAGRLSGGQAVIQRSRTLSVFPLGGGAPKELTLPRRAALEAVSGGVAVYTVGPAIHLLRLSDGRDRLLATVKGLVQAQLEPGGLFYGFNVPGGGPKAGRVSFVPAARLSAG